MPEVESSQEDAHSPLIREAVRLAVENGYAVVDANWWSKAFVVWMSAALKPELKARIESQLPGLVFSEWPGGPHDPGSRSFSDGDCAIAFPWTPPPVR